MQLSVLKLKRLLEVYHSCWESHSERPFPGSILHRSVTLTADDLPSRVRLDQLIHLNVLKREEWSTLQETSAEPPLVTDSLASLTLSSPKPEEGRVYPGLPGGECLEILYWLYAVP